MAACDHADPIMLLALAPAVLLDLGPRGVSRCGAATRPQHSTLALSRPKTFLPAREKLAPTIAKRMTPEPTCR
jgi:hypothetical protein